MSDLSAAQRDAGRRAFLDRIRSRQGPPSAGGPHPPPAPLQTVPEIGYRSLDGVDHDDPVALLPIFVAAAEAVDATVHVVDGAVPGALLAEIVEQHRIERAVRSVEPEATAVSDTLRGIGVDVSEHSSQDGAAAGLAITSATHGIAVSGSIVVDSGTAGSRAVSLLAPVHLCVLPIDRLVASHADVLRRPGGALPSCRVIITGPSRTGDIEQRLLLGAHGPIALHIAVVR